MKFQEWLELKGFKPGELTDQQARTLEALYMRATTGPAAIDLEASLRFSAKSWTVAAARKSLEDHGVQILGFEPAGKQTRPEAPPSPRALAASARQAAAERIAAGNGTLRVLCEADALEICAKDGDGKDKLPTFEMVAYTGVAMNLFAWLYPVVIDLRGLTISKRGRPVLKEHDREAIVGHTTDVQKGPSSLQVAGVLSGTAPADEVLATAKNGFPWRASVGVRVTEMRFIEEGKKARANGRDFTGPIYIARKGSLGEISFVALAADDETSAEVAASAEGDSNSDD